MITFFPSLARPVHCLAERCSESLTVGALLFDSSLIGNLGKLRVRILILAMINQFARGVATLVRGCIDQLRLFVDGRYFHILFFNEL